MALKFNPLKTRTKKNDGTYIFGDFSHGLYLLDTPRTINEQLASLALTGGRNIWAEKGALVPQFGYMPLAKLPDGEIVATVTKDSYSSSSFFIVTYSGKVFLYSSSQGLKEFKTTLPTVDNPIVAHRGNDLIINTEGNNYIFGTYEDSVEEAVTDSNVPVSDYSTYYTFRPPIESEKYYWNGKQISVNNTYQMNVNTVTKIHLESHFDEDAFTYTGTRGTDYTLSSTGTYKFKRGNSSFASTLMMSDLHEESFEIETNLYEGDKMGGQTLRLLNGIAKLEQNYMGNITQLYVSINIGVDNESVPLVNNRIYENLYKGSHRIKITYDRPNKTYNVYFESTKNNLELIATYTSELDNSDVTSTISGGESTPVIRLSAVASEDWTDYEYNLKNMLVKADNATIWSGLAGESDALLIRASYVSGGTGRPSLTGTVTLGEKTLKNISLVYEAESGTEGNKTLEPELFATANNRLFVVDVEGGIYYSAIGVVDEFRQAQGAGYFRGFYGDTSKTLSIEDFMDGVLICKENGIYYLTLSSSDINIKKIANIGQQSANDHVIVREAVYAYDTNSGSIVNAASVNVFGSLVAGNTIIDSTYLDSQGRGISSSPRWLTYNGLENVMILYYGEEYSRGIVLNLNSQLYPRELDVPVKFFIGFNQSVTGVTEEGMIFQDFKNGTIIEGLSAYADFEAIGLRDNRMICSSILEVTELNGIDYVVSTRNSGVAVQSVKPVIGLTPTGAYLPELIYSDYAKDLYNNSFELTTRWADKKASLTRIYSPMSGRDGVNISIEFPKNTAFCLAALRLPDFSQGE